MDEIFVVLPDQLFIHVAAITQLQRSKSVALMEDPLWFRGSRTKSVAHRAGLRWYEQFLLEHGIATEYVDYKKISARGTTYDYWVGCGKQLAMWERSSVFGDVVVDYTYSGLPVRYVDSGKFLLSIEQIRDCTDVTPVVAKTLGLRVADYTKPYKQPVQTNTNVINPMLSANSTSVSQTWQAAIVYTCKFTRGNVSPAPFCAVDAQAVLAAFLQVVGNYHVGDLSMLLPVLNTGLLLPVDVAKAVLGSGVGYVQKRMFVDDLCRREYARVLSRKQPQDEDHKTAIPAALLLDPAYSSLLHRVKVGRWISQTCVESVVAWLLSAGISRAVVAAWLTQQPGVYNWCLPAMLLQR